MSPKASFCFSATTLEQIIAHKKELELSLKEVAVAGRSNVGKSSLINHLTQNKNLAYVSSTPGKTQLLNFFNINDSFFLVDLPGYGFAKVGEKIKKGWGAMIASYLEKSTDLKLVLLLSDLRHPPTPEDLALAQWALFFKKPLLLIFTKADKLNCNKINSQSKMNLDLFSTHLREKEPLSYMYYSIKEGKGRDLLMKKITNFITDPLET